MITNRVVGSKITIAKGEKGKRPDFYPAILTSLPVQSVHPTTGRLQQRATYVALQRNLAGEEYLGEGDIDVTSTFCFDRFERIEELDGTEAAPKTWQEVVRDRAASAQAFLLSLPETGQSMSVADLDV